MTIKWPWTDVARACLLAGCLGPVACVDELKTDEPEVVSVRTIPTTRERAAEPGESVELGLQALGEDGNGINGVECFFAVSEPEWLGFDGADSAESAQRILTARDEVGSIEAAGLAVARLTALETQETRAVRVWAAIGSADRVADGAENKALRVWQFTVTISPEEADGAAGAGGAP